ncbi:MAG: hypothetical protein ABWX96_16845 [Propionibacteriaceae bacterium]
MSRTTLIILIVLAVAVAITVFLIVRRRRYVGALRERGWTFVSSPDLSSVLEHTAPPFGLGFSRSVDESISGTLASGVPFHVFEYKTKQGGPTFDGRVASLRLPVALPTLFLVQGTPRSGVSFPPVDLDPSVLVLSDHPLFAAALFSGSVRSAVAAFGQATGGLDLSIDGDHLVAVGAPKDPDELQVYLDRLAAVVTAMDWASLAPYQIARTPPQFGFFGRPDWVLVERDDSLIQKYGLTTVGSHHRTEQVLRGPNDGLPFEAFVHRWQTTRTETSTDSEGRTHTRTVTEHHDEVVCAVWLPAELPQLSLNGGWGGQRVRFEWEQFNDAYAVRTNSPKFAHDVIHPQMMEFLMRAQPPSFGIEGRLLRFSVSSHDTLLVGRCVDFAHEFLGRVPSFVWRDLGVTPPAFRVSGLDPR